MSWLRDLLGGKSENQKRYEALGEELEPWMHEPYDPNDPRNVEMRRKQTELTLLHHKIEGTPGWGNLTVDDLLD
jgi:hypothetical protein